MAISTLTQRARKSIFGELIWYSFGSFFRREIEKLHYEKSLCGKIFTTGTSKKWKENPMLASSEATFVLKFRLDRFPVFQATFFHEKKQSLPYFLRRSHRKRLVL